MHGGNNPGAQGKQLVSVAEFAAKYQTKREVYNFLTVDCKAYEPPIQTVSVWHLRDQACGKKLWLKADKIRHLAVPFYENLTVAKILEWVNHHNPTVV
jgi:hypothetical protein